MMQEECMTESEATAALLEQIFATVCKEKGEAGLTMWLGPYQFHASFLSLWRRCGRPVVGVAQRRCWGRRCLLVFFVVVLLPASSYFRRRVIAFPRSLFCPRGIASLIFVVIFMPASLIFVAPVAVPCGTGTMCLFCVAMLLPIAGVFFCLCHYTARS